MILSLPTIYEGQKMRSRTEARFAAWCDHYKLRWVYEPEGFAVDGKAYLPDFYLPEIRCVVEVKPPMFVEETSRMHPLIDSPESYGTTFLVAGMEPQLRPLLFWEEWEPDGSRRSECADWEGNFSLAWCKMCGRPVFCSWGSWACRCCGAYDGDGHLSFMA